ncbi:hypothetical protein CANCADRAFT_32923 [Tortispora caseinolytica NRRL Y-17796]|uniref:PRELI/MSF1 domain-containing protein n=1 Tax=Tortispora caseinolytica NRRL Y-17796 TaxID=767744 RepID=A0A1E4TDD2_9ASCO|nr:hypothetical protein CANCADRAFT_32923 [Tortispora caseinolytica NRRL Y-17796]
MKIFSSQYVFSYPWDTVTIANWQKYPNERCPHVQSVDVLRREVKDGVLRTERLISVKQNVPGWLITLIGGSNLSYVREVSEVDIANKSLTLRSTNLTFNSLLSVYETVKYTPAIEVGEDDKIKEATLFEQEAQISANAAFLRLKNKIEDWSVERFTQNAVSGKAGFESVLRKFTN